VNRYLLDTTVLIAHRRGDPATDFFLSLPADGHALGTTGVNVAEIERGLRPNERKNAAALFERLEFLNTPREAASRAGRYQAACLRQRRTIHTPDALITGPAGAHGAVLITDNLGDFPMKDIRVEGMNVR
jgi:predicted nucleic acid-binding protein